MGNLRKNIVYAFGSQSIQLLRSILVSLLVPKMMGIQEFGFWQLFIFYTQYGGFIHLGLIDGILQRNGGRLYEKLHFEYLGFQLGLLSMWIIVAIIPFCILGITNDDENRSFVILLSCLFVIINILYTFFLYTLQAVNRIKEASYGKIIISALFILSVILLIYNRTKDFRPYIYSYISAHLLGLFYYAYQCKEIFLNLSIRPSRIYMTNTLSDIKVGFVLLVSNIMGMLIVGFGRFLVDYKWGIATFAKVSFAFMFVNFFLMFINQASQVLFPDLRRRKASEISVFYDSVRGKLSIMFPLALLLYAPICEFVSLWLPRYSTSMEYLVFLLPLCIFDSKMNLLCNTIYKVFNKIYLLLLCNTIALLVSILLITISIYVFGSVRLVVFSMLIAIGLRGIVAEVILQRFFPVKTNFGLIAIEVLLVGSFIVSHLLIDSWISWLYNVIASIFYIIIVKKLIRHEKS